MYSNIQNQITCQKDRTVFNIEHHDRALHKVRHTILDQF